MIEECQMLINDLRDMAETFHEGSGYDVLLRVAADSIERLLNDCECYKGMKEGFAIRLE